MTKEELAQKIAQGDYTECQRDSKFSISFKIGDTKASVTKVGNSIIAMTVISTDISEDDYNKILKQALNNELDIAFAQVREITDKINKLNSNPPTTETKHRACINVSNVDTE